MIRSAPISFGLSVVICSAGAVWLAWLITDTQYATRLENLRTALDAKSAIIERLERQVESAADLGDPAASGADTLLPHNPEPTPSSDVPALPDGVSEMPPRPPCTTFLSMTPEEIWEEGKSRTAYERQGTSVWEKYEGACVKWTLPLKSAASRGEIAKVFFGAGRIGILTVATVVHLPRFPQLKLAHEGDLVEVQGRITWVVLGEIALDGAELAFQDPGALPPRPSPRAP